MTATSFLPEDYLAHKAERRTNLISLTLFGIVMIAVVGAFFVTNRQARLIKQQQEAINVEYQQASMQIQELTQLEKQKQEMLNKADLAAALVERVPRSILLAELINRMPDRLGLVSFDLKSERIKPSGPPPAAKDKPTARLAGPDRAKTKQEVVDTSVQKIDPPRYKVSISLLGVAPSDMEVSRYLKELNNYPLLREVSLEYSEQKDVDDRDMRQFKINMTLDPEADVRRIDPMSVPRVKNPMKDDARFKPPAPAAAAPAGRGGH